MWDGIERRKCNAGYCGDHIDMSKDVAVIKATILNLDKRINGTLDAIDGHMEEGTKWRLAIFSVAVLLFVQLIGVVWAGGRICRQIEVDSARISVLEKFKDDINK